MVMQSKCYKVYESYIDFNLTQKEFYKDLHKSILNKIMTTHAEYVKFNFVGPLNVNIFHAMF